MPILHKGVYQKTFIASIPRNIQTMTELLSKAPSPLGAQRKAPWRMILALYHKMSKAVARVTPLITFCFTKKRLFFCVPWREGFFYFLLFFRLRLITQTTNARTITASTILDTGARYLSTSSY